MIARLALHGMIQPSRVFCGEHREFRKILRLRHRLVEKRTSFKYQVKGILNAEMIRLSSVLSDVFGKSGMMLLTGIINGMQLNPTLGSNECYESNFLYKHLNLSTLYILFE
jgi:transposase